jgi:acyl-CoA synthetase (NDP forming)
MKLNVLCLQSVLTKVSYNEKLIITPLVHFEKKNGKFGAVCNMGLFFYFEETNYMRRIECIFATS